MKIKELVVSSLILVNGFLLLSGCGQISKAQPPETKQIPASLETKQVNLDTKKPAEVERQREKTNIKSKETNKVKLEKTEEEKKVERKVKKLLKSIEMKCKLCKDDLESVAWIIAPEWNGLEKIGLSALPTMLEVLKDRNKGWGLRYLIVDISRILCAKYKDRSLGEKEKEIITLLIYSLKEVLEDRNENIEIRTNIADTLGYTNDKRAVEPLINILKSDKVEDQDRIFRLRVVNSLKELKDKQVIEPLKEYVMKHYGEKDLAPALYALCNLGEGHWVFDTVIKMRKDSECKTEFLSGVLGSTRDSRAVEPLIEQLRLGNFWAAEALGRLWESGIKDDRIIEVLIESLKYYEDGVVIMETARTLGKIGDKRAIEPLIESFKDPNNDYGRRGSIALFGLSKFKEEKVIKLLEDALKDPKNDYIKKELSGVLKQLTGKDYQY